MGKMKKKKQSYEDIMMSVISFLRKNQIAIMLFAVAIVFFPRMIMADTTDAETMWTNVTDLIAKWVLRLGGVIFFVGGVMFGLGWKSDDAEQKSRGISTMIAGAIVMALAGSATLFFGSGE